MSMLKETAVTPLSRGRRQSLALAALWVGFVTYAVLLSPPSDPDTLEVIRQLSTGHWQSLNPWIVVLFNLMGLWPLVYASLALTDGVEQSVSAWPFVVGSFGLGAFALMPYLILRKPTDALPSRPVETILLRLVNHRLFGLGVAIATLLLLGYGIVHSDWSTTLQDFAYQFSTSQFIHVMSLDFCMLTLLTPSLLWDDMARRQLSPLWRGLSLLPLLGPALYLTLRPANPFHEPVC